MRANEKFFGKGHARHLCKDCARLGKEELAYRQTMRDLDRLLTWNGHIPRRNREQFRKYLNHEDERIRAYACRIEATDALNCAEQRLQQDLDDFLVEQAAETYNDEDIFPLTCGLFRRSHPRGRHGNPVLIEVPMAITCPKCGSQFDATLFEFGHRVRCDCGAEVEYPGTDLRGGHVDAQGQQRRFPTKTAVSAACWERHAATSSVPPSRAVLPATSGNFTARSAISPR